MLDQIRSFFSCLIAGIIVVLSTAFYSVFGYPKAVEMPSELKRDGTPKKYFTMSFDDGTTQDLKIIEILKKYNCYACSFNINTGLYGADWTESVSQMCGKPVDHIRFTEEQVKSGIYDGFDLQGHTRNHSLLENYNNYPLQIIKEVEGNANDIKNINGYKPVGMAWPGSDTTYDDKTIEAVLKYTNIRFARCVATTGTFDLPTQFMKWKATSTFSNPELLSLAQKFIDAPCTENMLFYVWGHGFNLDVEDLYDEFEQLIKMITENKDIVCVSTGQFYELFKDEIPSF